jgi:chromosome segregation ATPase
MKRKNNFKDLISEHSKECSDKVIAFFDNRREGFKDWRTTVKDGVIHRECSNMKINGTKCFPTCKRSSCVIKDTNEQCHFTKK